MTMASSSLIDLLLGVCVCVLARDSFLLARSATVDTLLLLVRDPATLVAGELVDEWMNGCPVL